MLRAPAETLYAAELDELIKTDKHVLIMASTRSGKGVTLIIPHLLRYAGSAFVLDPKGENAKATGRQRAKLNGKVHYLDPFGISGKPQARFNPLSRFTPDNMEAESKALQGQGFNIEASDVNLPGKLDRIDTYQVQIAFASDLKTDVKVWVAHDAESKAAMDAARKAAASEPPPAGNFEKNG